MSKNPYPEFKLLSEFLKKEKVSERTRISFKEVSDADNRYALQVGCDDSPLLIKLARFYGCPEEDLPEDGSHDFEACDSWHGLGEGDLREFGDELGQYNEPFFDLSMGVDEIHDVVANQH